MAYSVRPEGLHEWIGSHLGPQAPAKQVRKISETMLAGEIDPVHVEDVLRPVVQRKGAGVSGKELSQIVGKIAELHPDMRQYLGRIVGAFGPSFSGAEVGPWVKKSANTAKDAHRFLGKLESDGVDHKLVSKLAEALAGVYDGVPTGGFARGGEEDLPLDIFQSLGTIGVERWLDSHKEAAKILKKIDPSKHFDFVRIYSTDRGIGAGHDSALDAAHRCIRGFEEPFVRYLAEKVTQAEVEGLEGLYQSLQVSFPESGVWDIFEDLRNNIPEMIDWRTYSHRVSEELNTVHPDVRDDFQRIYVKERSKGKTHGEALETARGFVDEFEEPLGVYEAVPAEVADRIEKLSLPQKLGFLRIYNAEREKGKGSYEASAEASLFGSFKFYEDFNRVLREIDPMREWSFKRIYEVERRLGKEHGNALESAKRFVGAFQRPLRAFKASAAANNPRSILFSSPEKEDMELAKALKKVAPGKRISFLKKYDEELAANRTHREALRAAQGV